MKIAIIVCLALALSSPAIAGSINFNPKTENFCQNSNFIGWTHELTDSQKADVIGAAVGELWGELGQWLSNNGLGSCNVLKSSITKVCIDAPFGSQTQSAFQVRLELDCWGTLYRAWYEFPRDCTTSCTKK